MASVPLILAASQGVLPAQLSTPAEQGMATWTFHHEYVLGTSLELKVNAENFALAQRAELAALREMDRQDAILSAWRPDSEFSRWSATQFEPVRVSPDLFAVLAAFEHWRNRTGGALNASAEAAVRLWRRTAASGRTPDQREIDQTLEAMTQVHWQLDATQQTATRLTDVPLALASFAKSYVSSQAADAALRAGANGISVNLGGDVVIRGAMSQVVAIADPRDDGENGRSLESVLVRDASVATSGSYRRGFDLAQSAAVRSPEFSHIVDPRTARPVGHVLSSTVIAHDAETAGALATAFSVLSPAESDALAAATPGVAYMLVLQDGSRVESENWHAHQAPGLRPASFEGARAAATAHAADTRAWNSAFDLNIALNLPRIEDARYRRPYVAVWIEDADHFPVRTLALWTQNPRWLPELRQWYRDDQIRNLSENSDVSKTISSATRPPGQYTLRWDGRDNEGKPVNAGKYTVVVEASREHGGYQIERHEMSFNGQPQQAALQPGKELGAITLDYRKR